MRKRKLNGRRFGLESMESRNAPTTIVPMFPMVDPVEDTGQPGMVSDNTGGDEIEDIDFDDDTVPDSVPGGDGDDIDPGSGGGG